MDRRTCREVSEYVGVLANPLRILILCALADGECRVGELAERVDLPPAHVSAHLRTLYDRGYLVRRREWKNVFYSLHSPKVKAFLDLAAELGQNVRNRPRS